MSKEEGFDPADHLESFNAIVSAMRGLDRDSRVRLLTAIATFFDLPSFGYPQPRDGGPVASPSMTANAFSEDRSQTPKAFLFEKQPSTDVDRVACLAYYLTHYRDTPYFKTLDISKLNTEGAQLKFSNAAQAVDNATKAGLLVPATKGQKQLSAMGERYVQALPDRTAARETMVRVKPKRKGKSRSLDVRNTGDASESADDEQ